MKRRQLALIAASVVIAIVGVRWLGRERPTDEEQIRARFLGAARAAEEKQIGGVMEVVSERFSGRDLDKQGVKRLVAGMVLRGDWVAVSVAGVAVSVRGDVARANLDIVTARSGKGKAVADLLPQEAAAHRLTCRLEREDGDWRVVTAEWEQIPLGDALAGPPLPVEPQSP